MAASPEPIVLERTVLHHQDPSLRTDKLYIREVLDHGSKGHHTYTSWGRRKPGARGLASKEVTVAEAKRLLAEKMDKGYGIAAPSIISGLPVGPLTSPSVWRAVESGSAPAPSAGSTSAPGPGVFVDRSAEMNDLAHEGRRLTKSVGAISGTADPLIYKVAASDGIRSYTVDLRAVTCECPVWSTAFKKCKHMAAVAALYTPRILDAWAEEASAAAKAATAPVVPLAGEPGVDAGFVRAMTAAMGLPDEPEASAIARIFAPFVRTGVEDHPQVPALENLAWDEGHARRIALGFKRRCPTMLFGPTGSGKTAMVRAFAAMTNRPLFRINMNTQGTVGDLLGKYEAREGETIWKDGTLPKAMKFGGILLIDEADHMDSSVSGSMFSVMEENGSLTLKEHDGEVIEPHPDFCMFLTGNSLGLHDESGIYHGTQAMNAALLARCGVSMRVEYPSVATESIILLDRGVPAEIAKRIAEASKLIRDMLQSGTVVGAWGIRQSINFAVNAMDLDSFKEGFEATGCAAFTRDEFNALWEAVQRCTGTAAPSSFTKGRRASVA